MSSDLESLRREYSAAFEAYLKEPDQDALRRAGGLGEQALEVGLGLLEALYLHEHALQSVPSARAPTSESAKATDFLRAFLAPFDRKVRSGDQVQAELRNQVDSIAKELESFRYSVSHDLRAPLRAIDGFSGILEEEHAKALDEEGRHCLQIVRSSAARMGQLIEDLLLLVRVGRGELSRQSINLSEMAREVATALQHKEPERKVSFTVQEGIVADADPRLLRIVIENLLGNAWKFTAKTAEPRVEFGAVEQAEGTVFFVRDNGVGFNMEYAGKLFNPFQRLHSEAEFPGTGIGLAVVRRIVDRHGGRVWVEAAVDRGATVFFTLPPAPSRSAAMT